MGYRDTNQNAHTSDLRAYSTPLGSTEGDSTRDRFRRLLRGMWRWEIEHGQRAIEDVLDAHIRQEYALLTFWFRWCILHGLSPIESVWMKDDTGTHPTHVRAVDVNGTIVRVKLRRNA